MVGIGRVIHIKCWSLPFRLAKTCIMNVFLIKLVRAEKARAEGVDIRPGRITAKGPYNNSSSFFNCPSSTNLRPKLHKVRQYLIISHLTNRTYPKQNSPHQL